jgi:hypothetical protein
MMDPDALLLQELLALLAHPVLLRQLGQQLHREKSFSIVTWHPERHKRRLREIRHLGTLGWAMVLVDKTHWRSGEISGNRLLLHRDGRLLLEDVNGEYDVAKGTAVMRTRRLEALDVEDAIFWFRRLRPILFSVRDQLVINGGCHRFRRRMVALKRWCNAHLSRENPGRSTPVSGPQTHS